MIKMNDERTEPLRLLTRDQLAELLEVSKRTISRMLSAGELPKPIRFGRLVRWREADITRFLEQLIDQNQEDFYNRSRTRTDFIPRRKR